MGAKGIKRRKPYRRLPPPDVPTEAEAGPPNVMWPDRSAGFEASPWSPAGRAEVGWRFVDGLARGRNYRVASVFLWLMIAMLAIAFLGVLTTLLR